jgi:hypothetical protein
LKQKFDSHCALLEHASSSESKGAAQAPLLQKVDWHWLDALQASPTILSGTAHWESTQVPVSQSAPTVQPSPILLSGRSSHR